MDWAKLLLGLANLFFALITYAREKQLIDAGQQRALASLFQAQADVLKQAEKARADARTRNDAVPKSDSLPNDGFRRD